MYQKTEAICLHLIDFSETSQIARLFTREHGVVGVIAKGIKRGRQTSANPLGGPLDMLARGQAVFVAGREGAELATLSGWEVSDHWPMLREHLRGYYAGTMVAEVTMGLLAPHDPHPGLYDDLVAALEMLSDSASPGSARVVAAYIKAALEETGYWPVLERCVLCGAEIKSKVVRFVPRAGGIICGHCRAVGTVMVLPSLVVVALARLPRPRAMKEVLSPRSADPQALFQALQLLLSQVECTLDRGMRTRALLGEIAGWRQVARAGEEADGGAERRGPQTVTSVGAGAEMPSNGCMEKPA